MKEYKSRAGARNLERDSGMNNETKNKRPGTMSIMIPFLLIAALGIASCAAMRWDSTTDVQGMAPATWEADTNKASNTDNTDEEGHDHPDDEIHIHADFKVYINGEAVDFEQEKYMSTEMLKQSESFHLHDMDGDVIHLHAHGTIRDFFSSIGITLTPECISFDDGTDYCSTGKKTLKMYVNGTEISDFPDYAVKDLDRILLTYGNGSDLEAQLASVTDKACIQSGSCPERGTATDESCSSGGSNTCTIDI